MSRLRTDDIGVFISPRRIVMVRVGRTLRSTLRAHKQISVEGNIAGDWQEPLNTLLSEFEESTWHNATVSVVVADNWARYEVLPWSDDLSTEAEHMEYARLLMSKTYGNLLDDWTLTLSADAPRHTRIVTALPSNLVSGVLALSGQHGLRVTSIQPRLIVAFNSWRHRLPRSSSWFASVDDGSLAALHVVNGRCDRVRSVRLSDDWAVELDRIKTMSRLAKGRRADGPVYIDAPSRLREIAEGSNTDLHWLEGSRATNRTLESLSKQMEQSA